MNKNEKRKWDKEDKDFGLELDFEKPRKKFNNKKNPNRCEYCGSKLIEPYHGIRYCPECEG